jgi:hypothetical protein
MSATEITMSTSVMTKRDERRHSRRYTFTAEAEIVDIESGMKMSARISDFSRGGCYVDVFYPLPEDAVVELRLTKWQQTLETRAKVIYSSVGMGMGLMFSLVNTAQQDTIEGWLAQSRGAQPS